MCGIAGFVDYAKEIDKLELKNVSKLLYHRGPDDEGVFYDYNDNFQVGLLHRRLSIIDLSALGHQPMQSHCGKYWIVFNGEIYNFKEIKLELESKGINFKSNSDTE